MGEIGTDDRGLAEPVGAVKEEGILDDDDEETSPIEQVRLTVPTTDDPSLPVWTFRMWSIGLLSCALMSFLNQFFSYRTEPLIVTQITVQVASLPVGHFMARVLPRTRFRAPSMLGGGEWSLNPGPFNIKEHVLISIFANAGFAFGVGSAYAVGIINIIRAFYQRQISFFTAWLLVVTTQVLGYGWAGLMRKYVVEPAHMWWPSTLVQVSLFRALHEKDESAKASRQISRSKFFLVVLVCSFAWYVVPGYLFPTLTSISWVCWVFSKSVTAQQLGSGMLGLGLGAFTLDWSTVSSYLYSPLISPFFATANIFFGYVFFLYVILPVAYWGFNLYNAKTFPIFSSHLFMSNGTEYNIPSIVNSQFQLDTDTYDKNGKINLSVFFAVGYGFSFATIAATITHVGLFYGKEIYQRFKSSQKEKPDVHTKLMKKYSDIPAWWFHSLMALSIAVALLLCTVLNHEVQLQWWGLIFACGMAFIFTLPISIITATTNQSPGLNVITEYVMGLIKPGYPIANVCFKTYGYMSMQQAVAFLSDFKLGHYMKIPPKSMFLVQATMTGTVKVHNVSLKASEQDISEFFSFSGEIIHVELQSCDERSQFAYITFRDIQGAERAMLLTGATIEHMAVIITPSTDYKLPASVLADLESKNTGGMESALQKAEDIVGSMLAKGFVLGMDAVEKAKAFDEKHQLTSTATAKVASLDRTMGLSQKFSTGTLVVNEKMKEMDEKYQVAEKTKSALAAAEQTVSTASSAIMSNRYILTGAAWVTDAYNKVATTTTDVSTKTKERMMAEWEGANQSSETTKFDSLESSEADEQEFKRHEDDSTKNFIVDSPEMTCQESEHQAGERQMTNVEGNSKMIIEEQKNHEGQIAVAHMQENTETAEKNPSCHQSEVSKANVHDSVLMTEQCEREHKQPEGEFGKTHVPGSPVTIPVTMSTIDGNSSNSPKKPHSAEGFL